MILHLFVHIETDLLLPLLQWDKIISSNQHCQKNDKKIFAGFFCRSIFLAFDSSVGCEVIVSEEEEEEDQDGVINITHLSLETRIEPRKNGLSSWMMEGRRSQIECGCS